MIFIWDPDSPDASVIKLKHGLLIEKWSKLLVRASISDKGKVRISTSCNFFNLTENPDIFVDLFRAVNASALLILVGQFGIKFKVLPELTISVPDNENRLNITLNVEIII